MGVAVCQWNVLYKTGSRSMAVVCGPLPLPHIFNHPLKKGDHVSVSPQTLPVLALKVIRPEKTRQSWMIGYPTKRMEPSLVKNKYLWNEWRGRVWGSPIKVASPLPSSSEPALWSRGSWTCPIVPRRWAAPSSRAFCTTFSSLASSGCWWRLWCSSLWPGTWKWWITSALETSRWGISVPLATGSRRWWWLSLPSYNHKVMGCTIGKWHPSLSLKIINFMYCWSQGCHIQ